MLARIMRASFPTRLWRVLTEPGSASPREVLIDQHREPIPLHYSVRNSGAELAGLIPNEQLPLLTARFFLL